MPCGRSVGFSRYSGDDITVILLKVALNIITLAIQIRDKAPLDYQCDVLIEKSDYANNFFQNCHYVIQLQTKFCNTNMKSYVKYEK